MAVIDGRFGVGLTGLRDDHEQPRVAVVGGASTRETRTVAPSGTERATAAISDCSEWRARTGSTSTTASSSPSAAMVTGWASVVAQPAMASAMSAEADTRARVSAASPRSSRAMALRSEERASSLSQDLRGGGDRLALRVVERPEPLAGQHLQVARGHR